MCKFYIKAFESYRLTAIHTYIHTYIHTIVLQRNVLAYIELNIQLLQLHLHTTYYKAKESAGQNGKVASDMRSIECVYLYLMTYLRDISSIVSRVSNGS